MIIRRTALALAALLAGCSQQGHDSTLGSTRPPVLAIRVTPAQRELRAGGVLQLSAEAIGDSPVPQAVTWTVACLSGCDPFSVVDPGHVSPSGLYTAPDDQPTPLTVQVEARSVVGTTTGTASISVAAAAFVVEPAAPSASLGGALRFTADWNGQGSGAVAWACDWGSIDGAGRYVAPANFYGVADSITYLHPVDWVRATHGPSGQTVARRVQLLFPPPILTAVAGGTDPGQELTVLGAGLDGGLQGVEVGLRQTWLVFTDGRGGELRSLAVATPTTATATIPLGAATGPLRVELTSTYGIPDGRSNEIPFTRVGGLRVRAERPTLTAGETSAILVAPLGLAWPLPITLEASVGSVEGLTYTAPSALPTDGAADVRACVAGGAGPCAGVTIALRRLRPTPEPPLVPLGGLLQLGAVADGAPVAASWSLAAGGGGIDAAGRYSAPAAPAEAGPAWLLAGPDAVPVQVGVTGAGPGLLDRWPEPRPSTTGPLTDGVPWGASAETVVAVGGRAFLEQGTLVGGRRRWLDVLDVSTPARPAWRGAIQVRDASESRLLAVEGLLLRVLTRGDGGTTVEAYDLAGALPRLVGTVEGGVSPSPSPVVVGEGTVHHFDLTDWPRPASLRSYPVTPAGLGAPVERTLPLPAGLTSPPLFGAVSTGRAYLGHTPNAVSAYDLAVEPARFLGTVSTSWLSPFTLVGRRLVVNGGCLDLVPEVPTGVECGTASIEARALARDGSRVVVGPLSLIDVADPAGPRLLATADGPPSGPGALVGATYLAAERALGLGAYDLGVEGGPRLGPAAAGVPTRASAMVARDGYLYRASQALETWGTAGSMPVRLASSRLDGAWVLAAGGDLLLSSGQGRLGIWSLADPAAPAPLGELALATEVLELDGGTAWAGAGEDLVGVDLRIPTAPVERSRLALGAWTRGIRRVAPGLLALAVTSGDGISGDLLTVDVSDPAAPRLLGAAGLAAPLWDLAVLGATAVVVRAGALVTVDLAAPGRPTPVAELPLPATDEGATERPALHVGAGLVWVVVPPRFAGVGLPAWLGGYDVGVAAWPRLVSALGGLELGALAFPPGASAAFTDAPALLDLSRARNVVRLVPEPAPPRRLAP